MDYRPRYAQPFTLSEALALDVPVITEEITRLQNSLQHLRETQTILREHVATESPQEVDVEITKAIEENETVIGSQEERIGILRLALAEKGVYGGPHYDLEPNPAISTPAKISAPPTNPEPVPEGQDDDEGVYL